MNKTPFISIIVPVYNEERSIEKSLHTLITFLQDSAFPYAFAVTVINNASTDSSAVCIERARISAPEIIKAITLPEKGKGRALRAGWEEEGDVLAFMDADLSADLSYFRPLIDAIVIEGYDLASGNRLGPSSEISGRKFIRGFISRAYNFLIRAIFGTSFRDHQCGFKAIRKDAYKRIAPLVLDNEWFFDTELLVLSFRHGYKVRMIDIRWHDERRSKVSLLNTPIGMLRAIYAFKKRLDCLENASRAIETTRLA